MDDYRYEYVECACGHRVQRIDSGSASNGETLCGLCLRAYGIPWNGKGWREQRDETQARVRAARAAGG
jgi:hypothetical protein